MCVHSVQQCHLSFTWISEFHPNQNTKLKNCTRTKDSSSPSPQLKNTWHISSTGLTKMTSTFSGVDLLSDSKHRMFCMCRECWECSRAALLPKEAALERARHALRDPGAKRSRKRPEWVTAGSLCDVTIIAFTNGFIRGAPCDINSNHCKIFVRMLYKTHLSFHMFPIIDKKNISTVMADQRCWQLFSMYSLIMFTMLYMCSKYSDPINRFLYF